ncbi:ABC transporter substrate-binding protein [Nakamurella flava]|uniref:ABC transporter substrate-binding protein n=1 Tax=Nakamurella flava TaxID=2576308 RepID=A0A4U6QER5_9ACTN|nr:zinc ABC transporter substrate-binding protein [Nakamurella flava]TKV58492.1 ABC transporter substrate-binding protein [Nakamurella flava]
MNSRLRQGLGALSLATAAVLLTACGSSAGTGAGASSAGSSAASSSAGGASDVSVVASTNVWGDVVQQIAGTDVQVSSIISDPSADPHSFEANAQNQLALSKASLVVVNGGGYDDWAGDMLSAAKSTAPVINAVDVSGYTATGGEELNEHVWYDFPTVDKVAQQITDQLSSIDPADAATYQANLATFQGKLKTLEEQEAAIKAAHSGVGVAITEPVPNYVLEASGLDIKTPEEFSEAIENETDVPADVMQQTLAQFNDKQVKALVYNEQTTGPQTDQVKNAAQANGIPVVPVTETLPEGKDYLGWMTDNVTAIAQAVS